MKSYSSVKSEFEVDGSLRDIYIFDTNKDVWNNLIQSINKSSYKHEFCHGEKELPLPKEFDGIKKLQETDSTILKIFINNKIQVNCHFFTESEIEMDIAPNEITDEEKYNMLIMFLKWLSDSLNKPTVLTHENAPELVILTIESKNA
jgi:hypothetical protein